HRGAELLQLLLRQASDRGGGDAELDGPACLQTLRNRGDGEWVYYEVAVDGARDQALDTELGEGVVRRAARDRHQLADRVEAERLAGRPLGGPGPRAGVGGGGGGVL